MTTPSPPREDTTVTRQEGDATTQSPSGSTTEKPEVNSSTSATGLSEKCPFESPFACWVIHKAWPVTEISVFSTLLVLIAAYKLQTSDLFWRLCDMVVGLWRLVVRLWLLVVHQLAYIE